LVQERLIAEKTRGKTALNCGFVVFKSIKNKELALRSTWSNKPLTFDAYAAPQSSEVKWDALKLNYPVR